MKRHELTQRMKRIAKLREREAKRQVSAAGAEVRASRRELGALNARELQEEADVSPPDESLTGAWLDVVGSHRAEVSDARAELEQTVASQESEHACRVDAHRERQRDERRTDRMDEKVRAAMREAEARDDQREIDDTHASRQRRQED